MAYSPKESYIIGLLAEQKSEVIHYAISFSRFVLDILLGGLLLF
jgi:hypothetical protein